MKRFTPAWLAVCLACSFSTSSLAADALATRAFQGMPADFIKGADISTLLDAEKHGATFYDQNNQRKDPIAILKENGVNYVRLRLWVDPQSVLIFNPFGWLLMTWVSAPRASKTFLAMADALPFAQSRATFLPLKERVAMEIR